jgi:hypothetical protein
MKYSILSLISLVFILSSCEQKEEKKQETKKTVIVSTDIYLDVNDAIIEKVEKAQLILDHLDKLDADNVSEEEMIKATNAATEEIAVITEEMKEIIPVGKGGEEFFTAATEFLYGVSAVIQVYNEFAPALSIIEDDWTELQVQEWFNLAEPVFLDYKHFYKQLVTAQSNYAALQNIEIQPLETDSVSEDIQVTPEII